MQQFVLLLVMRKHAPLPMQIVEVISMYEYSNATANDEGRGIEHNSIDNVNAIGQKREPSQVADVLPGHRKEVQSQGAIA